MRLELFIEQQKIMGVGSAELDVFLSEPNTPAIQSWQGKEKLSSRSGNIEKYKGQYGGWRYIYRDNERDIIGAIQGVSKNKRVILSNIVTAEKSRRQGIAKQLYNQAKKDFKNLEISASLTKMGELFFGGINAPGTVS